MEGLSVSAVEELQPLDSRYAFRTLRISDDEWGDTGGVFGRNSERRGVDVLLFRPYAAFVFSGLHSPSSCGPRLQNTVCLVMLAGGRRPFEHGLWKVREGGYALVRSEHSFML